jgi:tetratricopeptide (TPR) repeat protein
MTQLAPAPLSSEQCEPVTTNGTIAVANLHAQIDGLAVQSRRDGAEQAATTMAVPARVQLIDLLTLRGDVLGRIADYELAAELAECLVRDAPDDGTAWLTRAKTRATFHRFAMALDDLDAAGRNGLGPAVMDTRRTATLQAAGYHADALVLCADAVKRGPGFSTLGALAVLHAEQGEVTAAEHLFTQARRRYQDISPFPIASLDYRRGLMWHRQGDLAAARAWFDAAQRRVPAYAPAQGRLAQIEAALGAHEAAIDRLHSLACSSDDPQYAASLAHVLSGTGRHREARTWRFRAAARYTELTQRHPGVFAHHAAGFRHPPNRWDSR